MADLTDEQQARLTQLLSLPDDRFAALVTTPDATPTTVGVTEPEAEKPKTGLLARLGRGTGAHRAGDDPADPTDQEIAAAIAALEADANVSEPAGAALSAAQQAALDLANANAEQAVTTVTDLATQLAASQWREEKQVLLSAGVPKAVLDAAEPVLALPAGAIDLSTSTDGTPNPVDTLRKVVEACKGTVDLSVIGETPDEDTTATDALLSAWEQQYPSMR